MSSNSLLNAPSSPVSEDAEEAPLAWLLAMLRQSMEAVMAEDAPPLKKAGAIGRLGNLYLKAYGAAELKQENKSLKRQMAELEVILAEQASEREVLAAVIADAARSDQTMRAPSSVAAVMTPVPPPEVNPTTAADTGVSAPGFAPEPTGPPGPIPGGLSATVLEPGLIFVGTNAPPTSTTAPGSSMVSGTSTAPVSSTVLGTGATGTGSARL
jgi:hypothetical protein